MWDTDRSLTRRFLDHYQTARGRIRTELVDRQVRLHLDAGPRTVIDIGGGDGQLALRFAEYGHRVTLVEPSPLMLAAAEERLRSVSDDVRGRVTLVRATAQEAVRHLPAGAFDVVMCHGVLMYVDDPTEILSVLARLVRPGGTVSVLTKHAGALAVRPALQGDFRTALASFDAETTTGWLGAPTRGDTVDGLSERLAELGVKVHSWYGVGVFTDHRADSAEVDWPALVETEWEASRRDPYRGIARLIHVVGSADE